MLDADTRQAFAGYPQALEEALAIVEEDATSGDLLDDDPDDLPRHPSDVDDENRRAAIAAMGGE